MKKTDTRMTAIFISTLTTVIFLGYAQLQGVVFNQMFELLTCTVLVFLLCSLCAFLWKTRKSPIHILDLIFASFFGLMAMIYGIRIVFLIGFTSQITTIIAIFLVALMAFLGFLQANSPQTE